MSWRAIEAVLSHSRARGGARLVLVVVAYRQHPQRGIARVSVARLARDTGLHRVTVVGALAELERLGELHVDRSTGCVSRYRVTVTEAGTGSAALPVAHGYQSQGATGPVAHGYGTSSGALPRTEREPTSNRKCARASRSRATTRARTSPRPAGDPRIPQAIAAFVDAHREHVGTPYVPAHGRDGAALTRLFAAGYELTPLMGTLPAYFRDRRSIERIGASVPLWCQRVPTLAGYTARVNGTDLRDAADVLAEELGDGVAP